MSKPILIAEGTFSKLTIELNDSVVQKLALIPKKDNPLASVELAMKKVLNDFEVAYFNYTHQVDDKGSDLRLDDPEATTTATNTSPKPHHHKEG